MSGPKPINRYSTNHFRQTAFYGVLIALLLILVEISSYVAYLILRNEYFAPTPSTSEFQRALQWYSAENFDPDLGWIVKKPERDALGARISPDNSAEWPICLSLYGDSFVFGEEVSASAAWANQLARLIKCRVLNFGVGGYGTDQAYLRFEKNSMNPSDVVVLGYLSENILRNVNQNRAFLYTGPVGPFKPLFSVGSSGTIELEPITKLNEFSYQLYLNDPRRLFPKEFFLPNTSYDAKQHVGFPYSIGLLHGLQYRRFWKGVLSFFFGAPPWYAEFYAAYHPSQAVTVTESIIDRFVSLAKGRGKTPVIMFFPTARDISLFLKRGDWVYQPIYETCVRRGYNCFNAGPAMLAKIENGLKAREICDYFCFNSWTLGGHYNEKGE